jgi:multidrug efflux pump subunit AcrA (membrane-fusion protein)
MREVLAAPYTSLRMVSVAGVGTMLGEQTSAAAQLRGGEPTVLARVGVADKSAFTRGQRVTIAEATGGGDPMSGTVRAVGVFVVGSGDEPSGYDVTVSVDQVGSGVQDSDTVRVTQAGSDTTARTSLSIPLTALRQDARGTYVSVAGRGDADPVRVPVTIGAQGDGWAEIIDGDLSKGQRVVVAGG